MERLTTNDIVRNLPNLGPPTPLNISLMRHPISSRMIRRLMKAERRKLAKAQNKNKSKGQ